MLLYIEKALVIGVIEDNEPPSIALTAEPVAHQLEHTDRSVIPPRQLKPVRDILVCRFESRRVACVHPEYPCLR